MVARDGSLRWLHVSDFHIGGPYRGNQDPKKELIKWAEQQRDSGKAPSAVFVTGDIGWSGVAPQYGEFKTTFCAPMAEYVSHRRDDSWLFTVPGNHDCDRSKHKGVKTEEMPSLCEEIMAADEAGLAQRAILVDRFSAYAQEDLARESGTPHWLRAPTGVYVRRLAIGAKHTVGVVGMNTAWLTRQDSEREHGQMSTCFEMVSAAIGSLQDCSRIIVLGHHPLKLYCDPDSKDKLLGLFSDEKVIYLHGHQHKGEEDSTEFGNNSLLLGVGAVAYCPPNAKLHSGFMVGNLDLAANKLVIEAYKLGQKGKWVEDPEALPDANKIRGKAGSWLYKLQQRPLKRRSDESKQRAKNQQRSRENLVKTLDPYITIDGLGQQLYDSLVAQLKRGEMMGPAVEQQGIPMLDALCTLLYRSSRETIALMASSQSTPDVEGVGRTGIALELLDVTIPYTRYYWLNDTRPGETEITLRTRKDEQDYRLLASDIAYVAASGGNLVGVAINGEVINAMWDCAREIYRQTDPDYSTGKHRTLAGRDRLLGILGAIRLANLTRLWVDVNHFYTISDVVVVKRISEPGTKPECAIKRLKGDKAMACLMSGLTSRLHHGSTFWAKRAGVKKQAAAIVAGIRNTPPDVYELTLSHPTSRAPQYLLWEAAQAIRDRKSHARSARRIEKRMEAGIGLRSHNEEVLSGMGAASSLRVLAVSGEHLLKDITLWEELARRQTPFAIELLLLQPYGDAAQALEGPGGAYEAHARREPGFLSREIRSNIGGVAALARWYRENKIPVSISVYEYDTRPSFRLTFVSGTVLVGTYQEGKRTGYDEGAFLTVRSSEEPDLYAAFEALFESIRVGARQTPL